MKILIIEKSFQIRQRFIRLISYIEGVESISVTTAYEEITEQLAESPYDLVIADISALNLFTFNGISKIKNKYRIKALIVLADFFTPQLKETYLEYGVDYFLDKTYEPEKIVLIIEELISKNHPIKNND